MGKQNELSLDNLFLEEDSSLENIFDEDGVETEQEENEETQETPPEKKEKKETSTKVTEGETPESVGNEGLNIEEGDEGTSSDDDGASPNVYASITKVMRDEGTFPGLTDEECDAITDSDSFVNMVNDFIHKSMDTRYQRIEDALNANVPTNLIKGYEGMISSLDKISEDDIQNEDNTNLRHDLIVRDLINKGYSKEKAEKWYQRSYSAGTEVDDAIEALQSNKEFYSTKYDELVTEAKNKAKEENARLKKEAADLKKSIMEDKNLYGEFEVDKTTRQKIYDSIARPVYTDEEGNQYSAIQKFEMENHNDFMKVVGLAYVLTNGGKDFNGLIKNTVKKEVAKSRKALEKAINNTSRNSEGNLQFLGGSQEDSESYFSKFELDI